MNSLAKQVRELILRASNSSGHGHIPTSFSIVEMVLAAYAVMNHDPKRPDWEERDLFVLSKAHAALGYYACVATLGYFDPAECNSFGAAGSRLGCHPDRFKQPWTEASCGSLGHGIGIATGMALGQKINKVDRRVMTVVGDGESNEGSVWENIMIAVDQRLDNLTILYDNNQSQTRCLQIPNPEERFRAFGCQTFEVDGHDQSAIERALQAPTEGKPRVVVCNTVKGAPCPTLVEEVFAWHRRSPNDQEVEQLIQELQDA